jgi:lysophospholipase L1-like esterase
VAGGGRLLVRSTHTTTTSQNILTSVAAYDSNKTFIRRIGSVAGTSGTVSTTMKIPGNVAYIIISTGNATHTAKTQLFTGLSDDWWPARNWFVIGDSISYGSYSSSGGLIRDPSVAWPMITASLLGYKLTNYAVPGMGFLQVAGMPPGSDDDLIDVLNESYTGAELVTVMLGTNDYGHDKTLGTIADASSVASIYGRIKKIVETMQTKCPAARLIFLTPIPRATAGSAATQYCKNAANGAGYTLNDVKNAIIESCQYYGIEYINLQDTAPLNYANKGTFLLDNLHPSIDGHKRLGEWMASRLTF